MSDPFVPKSTLPLLRLVGTIAPSFLAGTVWAYNYILLPPLLDHAPTPVLAKQWLQAYQFGARFVPPLVIASTLSNGLLAWYASKTSLCGRWDTLGSAFGRYRIAAGMLPLLITYTVAYMEPGINGELKLKVERLSGVDLKEAEVLADPWAHTATQAAKRDAEEVSLRGLVKRWGRCNALRLCMALVACTTSATASLF